MLIHLTTTGRYSSRGFTLIEVLCTLAMLSILSALAVPAMADMAARHRIDGLRAELIQSIQGARSEALARGQTVTLSRLTGCSTALVGASDWGCGWVSERAVGSEADMQRALAAAEALIADAELDIRGLRFDGTSMAPGS